MGKGDVISPLPHLRHNILTFEIKSYNEIEC